MEKHEELPLVEFKLNDENGDDVEAVSIVKDPAIEKSFQLFKAVELFNKSTKEQFKAQGDKQEITGLIKEVIFQEGNNIVTGKHRETEIHKC